MQLSRYTCDSVVYLFVLIAAVSLQSVTANRYCGAQLTRALEMLCVEFYSLEDLRTNTVELYPQRSANQFTSQLYQPGENYNENEFKRNFNVAPNVDQVAATDDGWTTQWFGKKPFHRFIVPHMKARLRRNVADECCRNDCNLSQLLSYCKVVAPGVLND